jgi:hypothetical protein
MIAAAFASNGPRGAASNQKKKKICVEKDIGTYQTGLGKQGQFQRTVP